jgi:membrane carboxypeptidase/penicillin-binding protein PbpC
VGNSGYEAMHNVTGLTGAAPIWHEVMRGLLQDRPDHPFERPDGLSQAEVCDLYGLLPTSACGNTHKEWFIDGTEPTQTDTYFQQIWVDTLTNSLATDATPIERRSPIIAFNFPAEAQVWAHEQGYALLSDYSQTPQTGSEGQGELVLLSPPPNTTYHIDPNFDLSSQQVQIDVAAGQGISQVTIWMDGNSLTTLSSPPYQTWWALAPGEHHVWAQGRKANGEIVKSDVIRITVLGK